MSPRSGICDHPQIYVAFPLITCIASVCAFVALSLRPSVPHISRLPTFVLLACSDAPAVLTLPRGRPDARGKNCRLTVARALPFLRSWLRGWSVAVGAVMDSIFVCGWLVGLW